MAEGCRQPSPIPMRVSPDQGKREAVPSNSSHATAIQFFLARVSGWLKVSPLCSKLITAEATEMPLSRSTAIRSERTRRRTTWLR
jgi:hypothetical protein